MQHTTPTMRMTLTALLALSLSPLFCQPASAQVLPHHGSASSSSTLWWITQTGLGSAGEYEINNASNSSPALLATTNGYGPALRAIGNSSGLVVDASTNGSGTAGYFWSQGGYGLDAYSYSSHAIRGTTYAPLADHSSGVFGWSWYWTGVYGDNGSSSGLKPLYGYGQGVWGDSVYGHGVLGTSANAFGVVGMGPTGVYGQTTNNTWAGIFAGNVSINGTLYANVKNFRIDHPLDPANKYLVHSCIESNEMINLYRGNVVLDANGMAVVSVPNWFEALNKNFSYQLTCVGGYAPVYVANELRQGAFVIAGGKPGLKVCWQITGERQDAYAKAHPLEVEQDKPEGERGKYLSPVEHGQPESMGIFYDKTQSALSHP